MLLCSGLVTHAQDMPTTQSPPPAAAPSTTPLPASAIPAETPRLSATPPGLQFDPVVRSGGRLTSAHVGQYVATMYRYAVGIVAIVAIVMTVYGGFRYLIGASMGDIAAGKKIIQDAIAGLMIALGAYLILQTVNPMITWFAPVSLKIVAPESAEEEMNNDSDTNTGGDPAEGGAREEPSPTGCLINNLPPGHFTQRTNCPRYTAHHPGWPCPDRAQPSQRGARDIAFLQGMPSRLTATNPVERILQAADQAIKCEVQLGNCGATAGAIWRVAGVHPYGGRGGHIYENSTLVRSLSPTICASPACPTKTASPDCVPITDSTAAAWAQAQSLAKARVREVVRAQQDSLADMLQPGDWFWGYNANSPCDSGQHSMIFVRWAGPGRAVVRQGMTGHRAWESTVCVKTGCGNFMPLTRIMRSTESRALHPATPAR